MNCKGCNALISTGDYCSIDCGVAHHNRVSSSKVALVGNTGEILTKEQGDQREKDLERIFDELEMEEGDRTWSNLNHPPERAQEYIVALKQAAAQANEGCNRACDEMDETEEQLQAVERELSKTQSRLAEMRMALEEVCRVADPISNAYRVASAALASEREVPNENKS